MRYFYQDTTGRQAGPYSEAELRRLHAAGVVGDETLVNVEGSSAAAPFAAVASQWQSEGRRTSRATADLFLPLQHAQGFNWLRNRKMILIAAVGLAPLFILATFPSIQSAFWAMAIYFSVLWALFFYYLFPAPGVRVSTAALCFFATGVLSVSVLLIMYALPPLSWLVEDIGSRQPITRLVAYILAVGLPEELCKALALFALLKRSDPLPPQLMVFYGLMSGLGFGIYEGVDYQMGRNFRYASGGAEYYLLNLVRVTALPFLHAIWTGIAGYFIGFAGLYPRRKASLVLIGIGVPAVLHGVYNTFNQGVIGLGFALLSVLALNLYLARTVEFEEVLIERNLRDMP